ncbi:MAG: DUF3106 domain-containing protein [Arenimonas sp.]
MTPLAWIAIAMTLAAAPIVSPPTTADADTFDRLPPAERTALADARVLWPQLPEVERERLRTQARHWHDLDAVGRVRLVDAIATWNALPAPEKAQRRTRFADWQQLGPTEQAQVRAAAARLAAMPEPERQKLRQRFAALPDIERARWRLGPALATQMPSLRALFDYLPAADQATLLATLRTLPAEALASLSKLAPNLSPARAQVLRRELLDAPADARGAVVARWAAAG